MKSRFQKDPERSLRMQKTRLAPALGHDGVRGCGDQLPSRPLLSPHKGPAAPTKICSAARLERPGFRPDAVGANPDSGPWRAGGVARLSFLFCERG